MSFNISKNNPFLNTKLTEKGREKLAKGELTFKYWAVGDSEINYGFEEIRDANPSDDSLTGKSRTLRPSDNQPNIKYFITKNGSQTPYNGLGASDIKVIKAQINNRAKERGFFEGNNMTVSNSPFVLNTGTVALNKFTGGRTISIDADLTVGNFVLFKTTTAKLSTLPMNSNVEPTPHLWYKIESKSGTTYTMDRNLPSLGPSSSVTAQFLEYASGEIYENGMANNSTVPYWDVNTLSFDSTHNITTEDVPFLNMNNVYSRNIIGLNTDTAEEFYKYGSNDMIGIRSPFMCYIDSISPSNIQLEDVCVDASGVEVGTTTDADNKAISVIHYTNNEITNQYGEYFYIDDTGKTLELVIPDLMYHRKSFSGGSGSGDTMGMTFVAKGEPYRVKNSQIEYYELTEHPDMVNGTPRVVGKVLAQHHTIIIDDDEVVAALSYKSGRNWTLPELSLTLNNPSTGGDSGLLAKDETIYVTYVLESSDGSVAYNLPCQRFAKITNNSAGTKDVNFIINSIDELPYMRKTEASGYDGRGFSAHSFKVLYQIVEGDNQLVSNAWKESDFTSTKITSNTGETIDPELLESQSPITNLQRLTKNIDSTAITYNINNKLMVANNSEPQRLQFGDERFFYGNLKTYIGATVYKTVFDVKVSGNEFTQTSNPTRTIDETSGPAEIRISEVGIYDANKDLVMMTKLSEPIKLINGNTVTLEFSMDF